jgi:TatA/E family protein of Tat protein translocase
MTSGQKRLSANDLTALDRVPIIKVIRQPPAFQGFATMFGSIGMPELIIILTLALIIFGPRKLPELGRSLGKSLGEFKRASNELRNTLDEEIRIEEERTTAQKAAERAGPAPATPVVVTDADLNDPDRDQSVPRDTGSA